MKPAFTRMMTIGGLLMLAGPLLGMLGTVVGITQSFEVLGANGVGDSEQLSAAIAKNMVSAAVGVFFGIVGVGLFMSGLIGYLVQRKRLKSQSASELPAS